MLMIVASLYCEHQCIACICCKTKREFILFFHSRKATHLSDACVDTFVGSMRDYVSCIRELYSQNEVYAEESKCGRQQLTTGSTLISSFTLVSHMHCSWCSGIGDAVQIA